MTKVKRKECRLYFDESGIKRPLYLLNPFPLGVFFYRERGVSILSLSNSDPSGSFL